MTALASRFGMTAIQPASAPARSGFVLRHHIGRDAPAGADRDPLLVRPRPDSGAAFAAHCGTPAWRRGPRPARRACSMNGASFLRNAAAFFLFKSISSSAPPTANRAVSTAGPPSRSSSRATVIFVAIPASTTAPAACTLLIKPEARPHPTPPVLAARPRSNVLHAADECVSRARVRWTSTPAAVDAGSRGQEPQR